MANTNLSEWPHHHSYYPVLPKLNRYGKFNEELGLQGDRIPFGGRSSWNGDDTTAIITNELSSDLAQYCLIDLDFSKSEEGTLEDNSGNNNIGIFINDYTISYDKDTLEPSANKTINTVKISKEKNRKAY